MSNKRQKLSEESVQLRQASQNYKFVTFPITTEHLNAMLKFNKTKGKDTFSNVESNQAGKVATRNLAVEMSNQAKGKRMLLLEGEEGETLELLLLNGHKLEDILVINWSKNTVKKLKAKYPTLRIIWGELLYTLKHLKCLHEQRSIDNYKKTSQETKSEGKHESEENENEDLEYLKQLLVEATEDCRPFDAGWLDTCGFPETIVKAIEFLCYRNLINKQKCYIAYTAKHSRQEKQAEYKSTQSAVTSNTMDQIRRTIEPLGITAYQWKTEDSCYYSSGKQNMWFSRIVLQPRTQIEYNCKT